MIINAKKCPHCSSLLNLHRKLDESQGTRNRPAAGDATLCGRCNNWLEFNEELNLIPITKETMARINLSQKIVAELVSKKLHDKIRGLNNFQVCKLTLNVAIDYYKPIADSAAIEYLEALLLELDALSNIKDITEKRIGTFLADMVSKFIEIGQSELRIENETKETNIYGLTFMICSASLFSDFIQPEKTEEMMEAFSGLLDDYESRETTNDDDEFVSSTLKICILNYYRKLHSMFNQFESTVH